MTLIYQHSLKLKVSYYRVVWIRKLTEYAILQFICTLNYRVFVLLYSYIYIYLNLHCYFSELTKIILYCTVGFLGLPWNCWFCFSGLDESAPEWVWLPRTVFVRPLLLENHQQFSRVVSCGFPYFPGMSLYRVLDVLDLFSAALRDVDLRVLQLRTLIFGPCVRFI